MAGAKKIKIAAPPAPRAKKIKIAAPPVPRPDPPPLTYRSNGSGTLHAAYLGSVRVGYVEKTKFNLYRWQLILLRPEGGAYYGRENTEIEAKEELERSVLNWTQCANLIHNPDGMSR